MLSAIGAKRWNLVEDPKGSQALFNEVETMSGLGARQMVKGTPSHERTGNGGWIGVTVELAFGQDVPDDHE